MIESSDRGITLNKGLAWTILMALVSGVWWGGATITRLQSDVQGLTAAISERRSENGGLESRVRTLENGATRLDAKLEGVARTLDELRDEQRATNELLRRLLAGAQK